jgi:hypothetical protein
MATGLFRFTHRELTVPRAESSAAAWASKMNALHALGRTDEWREAYRQWQAAEASCGGE